MNHKSSRSALRLVIVGGGFTGAVLAIHVTRRATRPLDIVILEPGDELGRGVAYGTTDLSHRMNVPIERMDIGGNEAGTVTSWFKENGLLPDPDSDDGSGRHYVQRFSFGTYINEMLHRTVSETGGRVSLRHIPTTAIAVRPKDGIWQVTCGIGEVVGEVVTADRVALCFGHAVPAQPCPLGPGVATSKRFVSNPWARQALAGIARDASVLIVGTGLTMADVVTSLAAAGHQAPITAVSRRGLLPKPHGLFMSDIDVIGESPPKTALELLRLIRRHVKALDPDFGWHPVIDSFRLVLHDVWNGLSAAEQVRIVRRLLPFWEIHRFRIAPQINTALSLARAEGHLKIERAAIVGLSLDANGRLRATFRESGAQVRERSFDAVVLCTGPERNVAANPLVASLLTAGTVQLDALGLGIAVDRKSRIVDAQGKVQAGLYAFGPMTRGSFGEMNGAPEIARHIEEVVGGVLELTV